MNEHRPTPVVAHRATPERPRAALAWAVDEAQRRTKPLHFLRDPDAELAGWCHAGPDVPVPHLLLPVAPTGPVPAPVVGPAVTAYDVLAPYLGRRGASPVVLRPQGRDARVVVVVVDPDDGGGLLGYAVEQARLRGLGLRVVHVSADGSHPDGVVEAALADRQLVIADGARAGWLIDRVERTLGTRLARVLVIIPRNRPPAVATDPGTSSVAETAPGRPARQRWSGRPSAPWHRLVAA